MRTVRSGQLLPIGVCARAGTAPSAAVAVALALFDVVRHRLRQDDPERGDAVQWVILAAVGAMMAIAVGTIIYMKVRDKANSISTDTPAGGTGP